MGGLLIEWLELLLGEMFEPGRKMFRLFPEADCYSLVAGTQDDANSPSDPTTQEEQGKKLSLTCEFLGWVLGRAFLSDLPVGKRLSAIVYRLMLAKSPDRFDYLEALREVDGEQFNNLQRVLDENVEGADLYFEARDLRTGQPVSLSLDLEEPERPVTEQNKMEYVAAMAKHLMLQGQDSHLINALISGFQSVVDPELLQVFGFDPQSIERHMEGQVAIDVAKWKEHTFYGGASDVGPDHPVIQWFWEVLEEAGEEERRSVLAFATSRTHLPLSWFEEDAENAEERFTIVVSGDLPAWPVPTASTCTRTLTLPPYESKEDLRHYLWKAIDLGGRGFGLA